MSVAKDDRNSATPCFSFCGGQATVRFLAGSAPGACSLYSPNENGEVTFRLLNPSDTPVILYKGSTVGRFRQITSPDDITSLESKQVSSMEAPSQSQ